VLHRLKQQLAKNNHRNLMIKKEGVS